MCASLLCPTYPWTPFQRPYRRDLDPLPSESILTALKPSVPASGHPIVEAPPCTDLRECLECFVSSSLPVRADFHTITAKYDGLRTPVSIPGYHAAVNRV